MENETTDRASSYGGGVICLIILALIGWWFYKAFLVDTSSPWWNGTSNQYTCVVHDPNDSSCYNVPVTVEGGRITALTLPNGSFVAIATNDCDVASIDGGLAGKGNRYCVIGELGGGREWQVSER